MYQGQTVFSQRVQQICRYTFNQCVARHRGHVRVRSFSCWDPFLCMVFAPLTGRHGLRDIEVCLHSQREKLYPMGFRGRISRTTLADANATRDYQIYQDVGCHLIEMARGLYAGEPLALAWANTRYALDSTTVDLCLSLFPWAHFVPTQAAIKIHTLAAGATYPAAWASDPERSASSPLPRVGKGCGDRDGRAASAGHFAGARYQQPEIRTAARALNTPPGRSAPPGSSSPGS